MPTRDVAVLKRQEIIKEVLRLTGGKTTTELCQELNLPYQSVYRCLRELNLLNEAEPSIYTRDGAQIWQLTEKATVGAALFSSPVLKRSDSLFDLTTQLLQNPRTSGLVNVHERVRNLLAYLLHYNLSKAENLNAGPSPATVRKQLEQAQKSYQYWADVLQAICQRQAMWIDPLTPDQAIEQLKKLGYNSTVAETTPLNDWADEFLHWFHNQD